MAIMNGARRRWLRLAGGVLAAGAGLGVTAGRAQNPEFRDADRTREKIVAVIRAFDAADTRQLPMIQQITPIADVTVPGISAPPDQLPLMDYFVGDLHLRYSFDDPNYLSGVSASDLKRLKLKREDLLPLSIANFRRRYPNFHVERLQPHLSSITGAGELEPSLMLDSRFWEQERARAKSDIIASVPARDTLVFSNRSITSNPELLRKLTNHVYETANKSALSRKLYLWNQKRWEVLA